MLSRGSAAQASARPESFGTRSPSTVVVSEVPLPPDAATSSGQATQTATLATALGAPFQAGGAIANTAFGITGAIPAGANVIGHVISDAGSTTAATQATAGNLNATVVGTGTFAVQASVSPYPTGATPETASSGNVANATAAATLATTSGKTTYITGFSVTGGGATTSALVTVTVAGVITGTMSYTYAAVAGATLANQLLIVQFPLPIPASGTNTTIVVSCPALGTGNTNNTVTAYGFIL